MTPVDNCEPTPSWSPTKTISAAMSTFEMNNDEDLVVEAPVEVRTDGAEDRVERRDDGDREVRLETCGHGRLEEQPQGDPDDEAEDGDHLSDTSSTSA